LSRSASRGRKQNEIQQTRHPHFIMKKTIFILVLAAAAGCGAWFWHAGRDGGTSYQSVPVLRGDLTQAVTASGTLNPVINVQVGSQISGNIKELYADFNSPVKAGQIVAQIDPATFRAAVTQAEGDLANAKAALELAQISAKRAQELRAQNAAPQSTLDQALASLHQAEASITVRQGALDRANVDLSRCTIHSPVDGIVISRNVDVGQTVAASMTAPVIFEIANDLSKMQIDTNVAEADIGSVEVGQDVEFTVDAFPSRTFHGEVIQVRNAPLTVQNVVTYDTVISVNNDDLKLKPGMTANVSIIIAHRSGVLTLGNAALRFRMPETSGTAAASSQTPGAARMQGRRRGSMGAPNFERTVYLLNDNSAGPEPVHIKTGIADGISTEVTDGLKEGDRVVTSAIISGSSAAPPAANPFGGGMRRF
jgi:HlyD family secretion protein